MKSRNQQEFLLHFFKDQKDKRIPPDYYEEKWIDGFMLIKRFNGDNGKWEVAVFTPNSYEKYKKAGELNQKTLI